MKTCASCGGNLVKRETEKYGIIYYACIDCGRYEIER